MRVWSFVQQKGGSGKSTICTNVAVCGEEKGETVLIVDLDPQTSATLWHSARGTNKPLVLDAIPDKLRDIVASASTLGVTLCLLDSPSKLDAIALAAIRASDMVICPTLPDLFNWGVSRTRFSCSRPPGSSPSQLASSTTWTKWERTCGSARRRR
jgi:chromosome partitioning protein